MAALLQEDESTFNLLGGLLPSAASAAALAAADAQHGEPNGLSAANAAAMQHLLQNYANQVLPGPCRLLRYSSTPVVHKGASAVLRHHTTLMPRLICIALNQVSQQGTAGVCGVPCRRLLR